MELSKKETICIARHLIAQHRQMVFDKISDTTEACSQCDFALDCSKSHYLWESTYQKIVNNSGLKFSLREGQYPLVPYDK